MRQALILQIKPVTPLADVSKTCDTPVTGAYTASSITVLSDSDRLSNPIFDWELAEQLAHQYTRPVKWINRSIMACREADVSPQYFIDRYLLKKPIPMNKDADEAFRCLWLFWAEFMGTENIPLSGFSFSSSCSCSSSCFKTPSRPYRKRLWGTLAWQRNLALW